MRPYIEVRLEDNVLIKKPNHVQKLNPFGAMIMHKLLNGSRIEDLLGKIDNNETQLTELLSFLTAVKLSLEGNLDIWTQNPSVVKSAFKAPFTKLPVLSEVAVTGKCNLRCSFCYAGINYKQRTVSEDLSADEIKQIVKKIRQQAQVRLLALQAESQLRKVTRFN